MTSPQQLIDNYLWKAPYRGSHWHSCKLMPCSSTHKYNNIFDVSLRYAIWYHLMTLNKEYSKSRMKSPWNSAKTSPKLTKTSKRYERHCFGIPCSQIWTCPTPIAILLVCVWNRHLWKELMFNYFLKMLGEIKRSILKVNLKK